MLAHFKSINKCYCFTINFFIISSICQIFVLSFVCFHLSQFLSPIPVLLVLALIGGAIFAFVWTKNGHSTHGLTPARALAILRETWSGTPAQQAALRINGEYTQAAAGSDDEGDNLDTNSADSTFASSSTRREKETVRGGNGGKETALGGDVRGRMAAVEAGHDAKEAAVGGGHNKDRDREFQMISISTVTIDTAATATGGRNNLLTNSSDEAERGRGLSQLDV